MNPIVVCVVSGFNTFGSPLCHSFILLLSLEFFFYFSETIQQQPNPPQGIIPGLSEALQEFVTPAQEQEHFDAAQYLEVDMSVMSPVTQPFSLEDLLDPYEHDASPFHAFEAVSNAINIPSNSNPNSFYDVAVRACSPTYF